VSRGGKGRSLTFVIWCGVLPGSERSLKDLDKKGKSPDPAGTKQQGGGKEEVGGVCACGSGSRRNGEKGAWTWASGGRKKKAIGIAAGQQQVACVREGEGKKRYLTLNSIRGRVGSKARSKCMKRYESYPVKAQSFLCGRKSLGVVPVLLAANTP